MPTASDAPKRRAYIASSPALIARKVVAPWSILPTFSIANGISDVSSSAIRCAIISLSVEERKVTPLASKSFLSSSQLVITPLCTIAICPSKDI